MKQRGIKIINKKFQVGFTARSTAVSMIALLVTAILAWFVIDYVDGRAADAVARLNRVVTVENDITGAFIDYSKSVASGKLRLVAKNITTDHEKNMGSLQEHIRLIDGMRLANRRIFFAFLAFVVLQVLLLAVYFIRKTHSIAGPIYVIDRMVQDMLDGREPQQRSLRKGDEFVELYAKITELYRTRIGVKAEPAKKRAGATRKKTATAKAPAKSGTT